LDPFGRKYLSPWRRCQLLSQFLGCLFTQGRYTYERYKKSRKTDRKVVTRSPQRKVGYINCRWFQHERIEHESQLEKRFVQCALLCPRLTHIKSQPFKIQIGRKSTYTPDFLLTFEDGTKLVVEVKIQSKVVRYSEKFRIAQKILKAGDHDFFVLTELDIDRFRQSLIAAEILRYGKSEFDSAVLRVVMDVMANQSEKYMVINELALLCDCRSEVIFHLIAKRQLTLHPDDYLNVDARVYIARQHEGPDTHVFTQHFEVKPWAAQDNTMSAPIVRAQGLRMRVKRAHIPYVRPKVVKPNQPIPHPLTSLAGGLPQTIKARRPGNAD
jgi:TnsA endonuclease N terminal